jgi:hypothetical protein
MRHAKYILNDISSARRMLWARDDKLEKLRAEINSCRSLNRCLCQRVKRMSACMDKISKVYSVKL